MRSIRCLAGPSAFRLAGPQAVQVHGVIPRQVQDFTFSSVELHEIPRLLPLQSDVILFAIHITKDSQRMLEIFA